MSHNVSEKQLAANRANAQKSTGPRSPEGKARSAKNALTHGLRAETYSILRLEDHGELDGLQSAAFEVYRPVNRQEVFAVERIALCQLSMLRAHRLETGTMIDALSSALVDRNTPLFLLSPELTESKEDILQQNRNYALAEGLARMNMRSEHFARVLRYQAQADRQYRRAIEDFDRLKRLRTELPNEPIYTFQPPPPEPYTPPKPEPVEEPWDEPVPAPQPTPGPQPAAPPIPDPAPRIPNPQSPTPAARSDASSPVKLVLLPHHTTHEIWRHRFPRKQLRSRRVLRGLQQPRAEGRIHLARFAHAGRR